MHLTWRWSVVVAVALTASCVLAGCSSGPTASQKQAVKNILTTTTAPPTTVTTLPPVTTTTKPGVVVPDVLGLKADTARGALHAVGFKTVPFNKVCSQGTLASQSVVAALAIPGQAPAYTVGALPLAPGTTLARGSTVGITWSPCYPAGTAVPTVVGQKFGVAVRALHTVGLTWACFSVGTTTTSSSTTTSHPPTTTTTKPPNVVLTQSPTSGAAVKAGTSVTLTMRACPQ